MAALRLGVRSSLRIIRTNYCIEYSSPLAKTLDYVQLTPFFRQGGVYLNRLISSESGVDTDIKVEYIESQDPEEWKYVERLFPPSIVPEPKPKAEYPSGWKPPKDEATKLPYFVKRTKNHLIPVYLKIGHRGIGKRTCVKKISGDIWSMENELKEYLMQESGKIIPSQVHELAGWILFKGDYVTKCQKWLEEKGF